MTGRKHENYFQIQICNDESELNVGNAISEIIQKKKKNRCIDRKNENKAEKYFNILF